VVTKDLVQTIYDQVTELDSWSPWARKSSLWAIQIESCNPFTYEGLRHQSESHMDLFRRHGVVQPQMLAQPIRCGYEYYSFSVCPRCLGTFSFLLCIYILTTAHPQAG
jgi:hypothetical protein